MKKIILNLLLITILNTSIMAIAHPAPAQVPHKPSYKEQRNFDKLIDERLNLTKEQKEKVKENRAAHFKDMQKIVSRMQILHDKIRNVYLTGIPPFQAELRTAPYKAELVLLKQNADKLRQEHRKNFEAILTPEQKVEFEKLRKELATKRHKKN